MSRRPFNHVVADRALNDVTKIWLELGCACDRVASDYGEDLVVQPASTTPCTRKAFGKPLIEHEAVGFMLADSLIDLKQAELMIDWCAVSLDSGSLATTESSMSKAAARLFPGLR